MATKMIPKWENLVEKLGVPGIAAIILLPVLVPVVGKVARPLAKEAIKGGILLYAKGKSIIAEAGETLEDIVAEAMAELSEAEAMAEMSETEVQEAEAQSIE